MTIITVTIDLRVYSLDDVILGLTFLTCAVLQALLGRWPVSVDPTWMTVIITPGTGVNDRVTVVLPQITPVTSTLDLVRGLLVMRTLRRRRKPDNQADARCDNDDHLD